MSQSPIMGVPGVGTQIAQTLRPSTNASSSNNRTAVSTNARKAPPREDSLVMTRRKAHENQSAAAMNAATYLIDAH